MYLLSDHRTLPHLFSELISKTWGGGGGVSNLGMDNFNFMCFLTKNYFILKILCYIVNDIHQNASIKYPSMKRNVSRFL